MSSLNFVFKNPLLIPILHISLNFQASNRCNLALRIGEGIANLKRFYFNTLTRKCTEFVYKGIKGNENSFLTIDECKAICES